MSGEDPDITVSQDNHPPSPFYIEVEDVERERGSLKYSVVYNE